MRVYRESPIKTPDAPYPPQPHAPRPTVRDLRNGYYVQDGPATFGSTYERRVGGTTWHWQGTAMRFVPNDFRLKTLYGVGLDWPLDYSDLEPWYLEAEREIGIAGDPDDDLDSPRSGPYPLPPIPASFLGVANSSDQVGRNLMDHPALVSLALARDPVYPYRGPGEISGIEHMRDGPFRAEHAAFRMPIGNDG